jgi:ribonuclease HI
MDGSNFLVEGKQKAGAAVVDRKQVIWASSLPEGTSAQKAKLVALIQALQMEKRKSINIYTDSRYAFATAGSNIQTKRSVDICRERPNMLWLKGIRWQT